jgi:parvulin-like peptidyl-prolyl isomerase
MNFAIDRTIIFGGFRLMRFLFCICLVLLGMAFGQAPQPSAPPAAAEPGKPATSGSAPAAPQVEVGPNDTVLTLKNFCADTKQQGDSCKTVITRAQFDKLADALQPNMSPAIRRNLANKYTIMLRMSTEAEKRGLDKQQKFEETMRFARMQILSGELSHALQEDAGKISDEELEDYYKKNPSSYEQATLAKVFIPLTKQVPPPAPPKPGTKAAPVPATPTEVQRKAGEQAMKKVSDDLHAQMAKGEDPDKLQKEAFAAAGLPGNPPKTQMEKVRRNTLPATHKTAMDLKPGEVSEVFSDPSGYYIYKMVSKEAMPLDSVKIEIRSALSSKRYRDSMESFQNNVEMNDAYFGPSRNPAMPPPPRGARPPAEHAEDPD